MFFFSEFRNEKEIARRKLDKEEERNLASMSFSKAAKYLFGSSTSTPASTSTSTSTAPAADVTINSEKERRKEEKSRRKYSRQLNEAGKDEEYDDQADVSNKHVPLMYSLSYRTTQHNIKQDNNNSNNNNNTVQYVTSNNVSVYLGVNDIARLETDFCHEKRN
jgi:hypothetical protein